MLSTPPTIYHSVITIRDTACRVALPEAANVETIAGERREQASDDTRYEQHRRLPPPHVVHLVIRLALTVAIEHEEGEGEREPDAHEANLLLLRVEITVDRVESRDGADDAT